MKNTNQLSRREFLRLSAIYAAGVVLAACAPTAETPVPAPTSYETTAPALENTSFPVIEKAVLPQNYILKGEAPGVYQLAKLGLWPTLQQRLPDNPLVLSPVDEIGVFGGRIRSSLSNWEGHFQEFQYGHSPLRWIDDGMSIMPGICDSWSANSDNSEWTLHIRQNLKWSDGNPCTVDDIMFWWDDLSQKGDPSFPDPIPDFGRDANGKLAEFVMVDSYTLLLRYGTPAPLTAKRLAMWVKAFPWVRWIAPAHYLKQFHPKYSAGVTGFQTLIDKANLSTNPEMPSLNPWIVTRYEPGQSLTAERNPYYYAVDPNQNQLPYIDGMDWIFSGDKQTQISQLGQGMFDLVDFNFFAIGDYATVKDNAEAGGCEIFMLDSGSGTGMMYFWNYDIDDDRMRSLFRDPRFKRAMSYALDRAAIQKDVYDGYGFITTGTLSPKAFEFVFSGDAQDFYQKARDVYAAYDPASAEMLLDEAGCPRGSDGWRVFADGGYLEIRIDLPSYPSEECWKVLDIARSNWEKIGLIVKINQTDNLYSLWESGRGQIRTDMEVSDGPDHLVYPAWVVPSDPDHWAPLCGRLLQYQGTDYEFAESDKWPWDRQPPRFNRNDAYYTGTPVEKIHDLYRQAMVEVDEFKRAQIVWEMWQIHMYDGPFFIGTVSNTPKLFVKSKRLTNIPNQGQHKLGGFVNPWTIPYPAITNPETYSFKPDQVVYSDLPQVYPIALGTKWDLLYTNASQISTAVVVQMQEPAQTLDIQTAVFDTSLINNKFAPEGYIVFRAVTNFDVVDKSTGNPVTAFAKPMVITASYTEDDATKAKGKDNLELMVFINGKWEAKPTDKVGDEKGGFGTIEISSWNSHICWGSRGAG